MQLAECPLLPRRSLVSLARFCPTVILAFCCAVFSVGCDSRGPSSPTSPSAPSTPTSPSSLSSQPNVAGVWGARVLWVRYFWLGEFTLEQQGDDVTGVWKAPGLASQGSLAARITGPLDSGQTLTGTITINADETVSGPACTETAPIFWGRLDSTQTFLTLQAYFPKCADPNFAFTFEMDRRCWYTELNTLACNVPPPPPPPPGTPTFTLSGRVVDDKQLPLVGARVEVVDGPAQGRFVVTDENGEYTITDIVQGQWIFRASKVGYLSQGRTVNLIQNKSQSFALTSCERAPCQYLPNSLSTLLHP